MTKPCPYCKAPLTVRKGQSYWCGRANPERHFKWDGKRFRRIRKRRAA